MRKEVFDGSDPILKFVYDICHLYTRIGNIINETYYSVVNDFIATQQI